MMLRVPEATCAGIRCVLSANSSVSEGALSALVLAIHELSPALLNIIIVAYITEQNCFTHRIQDLAGARDERLETRRCKNNNLS